VTLVKRASIVVVMAGLAMAGAATSASAATTMPDANHQPVRAAAVQPNGVWRTIQAYHYHDDCVTVGINRRNRELWSAYTCDLTGPGTQWPWCLRVFDS
jgi:hypothetical protein